MFSIYLYRLFGITIVFLISVGALNYFVDPAGIYHPASVTPERYALKLLESKNGLLWPEGMFAERELIKELTKYAEQYDCVVIGSSHSMQISSFSNSKSLMTECPELINLGASGASLEDHFVLSYLSTKAGAKSIVLGVDPWTMTHNRDLRWLIYRDIYKMARKEVLDANTPFEGTIDQPNKLTNLLNVEYTERSFLMLKRLLSKGALKITPANIIHWEVGNEDPIKLPDGSLIYSSSQNNGSKNTISDRIKDKTVRVISTERGVREYRELLIWLLKHNITPVLLMTPYHHNIWKRPESSMVRMMTKTEKIVLKLGKELGLKIVGSYRPEMFGCQVDEFYDYQHAKAACLSRLKVQSIEGH
jgi:hypothetical protein